uniref:Sugar phosphate transporter domain-containing protein n=1 Tax=Aplanochytrium stocchinoi TaxID=215587 RepID=A0A7S3PK98_9STRA
MAKGPVAAFAALPREGKLGILLIGFGCLSNVIVFEAIVKRAPGSGSLVTLLQFIFVALSDSSVACRPRKVKMRAHMCLTALFLFSSFACTKALEYKISMPLHIVLKSSSLVFSLLMGLSIGKRYSHNQCLGVFLVTFGIVVAILGESLNICMDNNNDGAFSPSCCEQIQVIDVVDSREVTDMDCSENNNNNHCAGVFETPSYFKVATSEGSGEVLKSSTPDILFTEQTEASNIYYANDMHYWFVGLFLMLVGIIIAACLGHYQEYVFKTYGRHTTELKFYTHILAFPILLVMQWENLQKSLDVFSSSHTLGAELEFNAPFLVPLVKHLPAVVSEFPILWLLVLVNVVFQYYCVTGVFIVGSVSSTLTCNLIVTCRKFCSLILSVWYFNNYFSTFHWIGANLVFCGVMIYSGFIPGRKKLHLD